jgi:hypothetical protein
VQFGAPRAATERSYEYQLGVQIWRDDGSATQVDCRLVLRTMRPPSPTPTATATPRPPPPTQTATAVPTKTPAKAIPRPNTTATQQARESPGSTFQSLLAGTPTRTPTKTIK